MDIAYHSRLVIIVDNVLRDIFFEILKESSVAKMKSTCPKLT